MKGAVAAMIVALGRLRRRGLPERGSVLLVLTADEEAGGRHGAVALAADGVVAADAMVIGEPCGIDQEWESIDLACRGVLLFRVDVQSEGGHSALHDRGGAPSAAMAAVTLADRLAHVFSGVPGWSVNVPATIEGGSGYGVTAARASFRGDVRLAPGVRVADAEQTLRSIVRSAPRDGVSYELVMDELGTGGYEAIGVAEGSPIAAACARACETVLRRPVPFGVFPGGTDAYSFGGVAGIPTVSALGPGSLRRAHHPNEHVPAQSLAEAVAIYEGVVLEFLSDPAATAAAAPARTESA